MPQSKDVHVSGNRSDGYRVTVNRNVVATAETQAAAAQVGRHIAIANQSELYVHRTDNGQIRERNTYGHDPHPPKG